MKKYFILIVFILILFPLIKPQSVLAQTMSFDPSTMGAVSGNQFSVNININTGSQQTSSADAMILFDSSILAIQSVSNGGFYSQFASNPISGTTNKYLISGFEVSPLTYKSGSGVLATIVFQAKSNGTSPVSFECTPGSSADTNIALGTTAADIINCSALTPANYTVGPSGATPVTQNTSGNSATPSVLPRSGSTEVTFVALGVGVILAVIGLAILI